MTSLRKIPSGGRACALHVRADAGSTVCDASLIHQADVESESSSRTYIWSRPAQLLMTGEPSLVAGASALLESALRYNSDVLPRLYLTGAFFMVLAYCGSNLLDIAQLFRARVTPQCGAQPRPCILFRPRTLSLTHNANCNLPKKPATRCGPCLRSTAAFR